MRTIIVIFTERKVSPNEIPSYKKYKFLCNYDTVSLYDMVEDPRYTGKMMVVGVYKHNTVQYAGIVYFKNLEDVIKAVKILGNKVKNLFD